jgi:HSP20 family protein
MANISRFYPFNIDEPFEDILRLFWKPVTLEQPKKRQMAIDVKENDKEYIIYAELPGFKKEGIKVSISNGNQIAISAETQKTSEEKKDNAYIHRERYFGTLYRSFSLVQNVDETAARVTYRDGVLELILPKHVTSQSKQLEVQ